MGAVVNMGTVLGVRRLYALCHVRIGTTGCLLLGAGPRRSACKAPNGAVQRETSVDMAVERYP